MHEFCELSVPDNNNLEAKLNEGESLLNIEKKTDSDAVSVSDMRMSTSNRSLFKRTSKLKVREFKTRVKYEDELEA